MKQVTEMMEEKGSYTMWRGGVPRFPCSPLRDVVIAPLQ